jgi:hypothetical protein
MTRSWLTFALALLALTLLVPSAQANHVQCGDVITQSTKLDSDLINCPANGVVIGADGITLDLNGHTIDGTGFHPGSSNGVDDSGGFDGPTIEGGTIRDFRYGVFLDQVDGADIRRVEAKEDLVCVRLRFSTGNTIEQSALVGNGEAVALEEGANRNRVTNNEIAQNSIGVFVLPFDNNFPHPPELNRIERNSLSANGTGISIPFGYRNTVADNRINSTIRAGIDLGSFGNVAVRNFLSGNGIGIQVAGQGTGTLVAANRIAASAGDGIQVTSAVNGVTIERNTSNQNGDDGIDVDTPSAVIAKNTANFNTDFGIEAVPGVTDGGGNKARGNGNPAQCLNVTCK